MRTEPLAKAVEGGGFSREDMLDVLIEWLSLEFEQDQYASMIQAGVSADKPVPLAKVFMDLSVTSRPASESPFLPKTESLPFIASMLRWEGGPLSSSSVRDGPRPARLFRRAERRRLFSASPATVLLVGGPGQGKSTLGQFLCQVHRAALLAPYRKKLPDEVLRALDLLDVQRGVEQLPNPTTVRWPIRVELRLLAEWLANTRLDSPDILDYVAHDIRRWTERAPSADDLRLLLQRVSWLLVLDGLDEVPPSVQREVLSIPIVRHDTRSARSHGLVLATTRPQGCEEALDDREIIHLVPLSEEGALRFSKRLANVWFPDRPRDHKKLVERIERALKDDSTARLTKSPLQVTILALLVTRLGRAPGVQWELFDQYTNAIYNREQERDTHASELLAEHRGVILDVHRHLALLLHTESERAEGGASMASRERVEELIARHLMDGGKGEARSRALAAEILRASAQRLVLLAELQRDRYGFEVRSLQEFMAAAALTSGYSDEDVLAERLRAVGASLAWRNVVRFAVGRFFAGGFTARTRRVVSVELCEQIERDSESGDTRGLHLGVELAIDLLDDGAVMTDDRCALGLVRVALGALADADDTMHGKLGEVLAKRWRELESEGRELVLGALRRAWDEKRAWWIGAWRCAATMSERGVGEVDEALRSAWVRLEVAERRKLAERLAHHDHEHGEGWAAGQIEDELEKHPPTWLRSVGAAFRAVRLTFPRLWAFERTDDETLSVVLSGALLESDDVSFYPGRRLGALLPEGFPTTREWLLWNTSREFGLKPDARSLAKALHTLAHEAQGERWDWGKGFVPWPLWCCLSFMSSAEGLEALATRAENGDLGDREDWLAAEERWETRGLTLEDLWYEPTPGLPFDREIRRVGIPVSSGSVRSSFGSVSRKDETVSEAFLQRNRFVRRLDVRERNARVLLNLWSPFISDSKSVALSDAENLRELIARADFENKIPDVLDPNTASADTDFSREVRALMQNGALHHRDAPLWLELLGSYGWRGKEDYVRSLLRALVPAIKPDDLALRDPLRNLAYGLFRPSSSLTRPSRWEALGLPSPGPAPEITEPRETLWSGVVTVESVTIHDLRAFDELSFATVSRPAQEGQWTLLLGENGAGKTTVLRALALALTDPGTTTGIQRNTNVPAVRHGQRFAAVKVRANGRPFGVEVSGDPGHETVLADEDTRGVSERARPWVVGYGCRRGSALGGPEEKVSFSAAEEVDTLFDGKRGLIHAETWLIGLKAAALQDPDGPAAKRFQTVQRVLCGNGRGEGGMLPGVRSIDLADERIWVEGPTFPRTLLDGLSDGYITTAGWVIDLMARWINRCKRLEIPVVEGFNKSMEGVVLIDEIDLNLHPLWQTRVIETTRRLFPRLSFVATTHNPLTLIGARKGEVFVFVRANEGARFTLRQIDLPEGIRADQVLTGFWFGLESAIVDRGTIHMLDEHIAMLRRGVAEDDPARRGLEQQLRLRLGNYAETSLERMAQSVAAELMAEEQDRRGPVTPDERARFRERLKKKLRAKKGA